MDNLECTHIINNPEIKFYKRYVDDCYLLIDGDANAPNNLLYKINQIHPNIKFTLEQENNNSLNFLDLTIKRKHN